MAKNKNLHSEETWKSGSGAARTPKKPTKRERKWVNIKSRKCKQTLAKKKTQIYWEGKVMEVSYNGLGHDPLNFGACHGCEIRCFFRSQWERERERQSPTSASECRGREWKYWTIEVEGFNSWLNVVVCLVFYAELLNCPLKQTY